MQQLGRALKAAGARLEQSRSRGGRFPLGRGSGPVGLEIAGFVPEENSAPSRGRLSQIVRAGVWCTARREGRRQAYQSGLALSAARAVESARAVVAGEKRDVGWLARSDRLTNGDSLSC